MRYTKGKWVASSKDTYYVGTTLNKIVYAHIKKLHEGLSKSECHGVPMRYVSQQALIDGIDESHEADVDKADLLRMKDLEELLWVFGTEQPDIRDYDFHIKWVEGEPKENGNTPVRFVTIDINGKDGEAEKERYHNDLTNYHERKEKGYKLFGEIYSTLDW